MASTLHPSPASGRSDRHNALVSLGIVLGPLVVWGTVIGIGWLLSADHNADGQCEGIGWGCTLTPRDGMAFVGLLGAFTVVPLATLLTALVVVVRRPRHERPTILAWCLGTFATLCGLGALLLIAG